MDLLIRCAPSNDWLVALFAWPALEVLAGGRAPASDEVVALDPPPDAVLDLFPVRRGSCPFASVV